MSLIQFVITHDFVLVGGDTRGTDINEQVVNESSNKVLKLNKGIIIGCSGIIQDAYRFLGKYCNFERENGLSSKYDNFEITYNELISDLNEKYEELLMEHNDKFTNISYNFTVIVCGHDGVEFQAMQYSITDGSGTNPMGIHNIKINTETGVRCFLIGSNYLTIHNENNNSELKKNVPDTILQYRNVMQNVFDMGVKFDKTINNKAVYEKIKRKDVLLL